MAQPCREPGRYLRVDVQDKGQLSVVGCMSSCSSSLAHYAMAVCKRNWKRIAQVGSGRIRGKRCSFQVLILVNRKSCGQHKSAVDNIAFEVVESQLHQARCGINRGFWRRGGWFALRLWVFGALQTKIYYPRLKFGADRTAWGIICLDVGFCELGCSDAGNAATMISEFFFSLSLSMMGRRVGGGLYVCMFVCKVKIK